MDFAKNSRKNNFGKKTYKKHFTGGISLPKTFKNGLSMGGDGSPNLIHSIPTSIRPYLKKDFQYKNFQIKNLWFLFQHPILQHFWDYLTFPQKETFLKRKDVHEFFDYLLQKKIIPSNNDDMPKQFEVGELYAIPEFFQYFFYLEEN